MPRSPTRLVALALVASGCERDPSFFGIWDLEAIEVDGLLQVDAGVLEIADDAQLHLLLRYRFEGGAFVPDPEPGVIRGDTSARENDDVFDNYQQKGEVHTLTLAPFDATFAVARYTGDTATLEAPEALYPRPLLEPVDPTLHAITLELVR